MRVDLWCTGSALPRSRSEFHIIVVILSFNSLLPWFVRWLGCSLNVQLGSGSVFAIEGFLVGCGGCFSDRVKEVTKGACIVSRMRSSAAMSAPRCAGLAISSALL